MHGRYFVNCYSTKDFQLHYLDLVYDLYFTRNHCHSALLLFIWFMCFNLRHVWSFVEIIFNIEHRMLVFSDVYVRILGLFILMNTISGHFNLSTFLNMQTLAVDNVNRKQYFQIPCQVDTKSCEEWLGREFLVLVAPAGGRQWARGRCFSISFASECKKFK